MAALIPSSNVEAAYEDMFKEITRKLYGEETGNGLHTLGTPVAQVATTGPTAPEGERSFTNLQIDRSSAPTIEYEHNAGGGAGTSGATTAAVAAAAAVAAQNANVVIQQQPEGSVVVATTGGGSFKSEDHLSTAFGLAALMQNGFAAPGNLLGTTQALNKVVSGQQQQQQQSGGVSVTNDQQQRWGNDGTTAGADQQPQIVQWTTGGKLQSYTTAQQQQQQLQQLATTKSKSKNRNDHSASVNSTEVIYTSPSTSGNVNVNAGPSQTTPGSSSNSGGSTSSSSGGGGNSRKKNNNTSNQQNANNNNNSNNNGGIQIQKRYACTHCPYSTDRRDLYTRHENIHKDEKPFQCYACLKQFNRADHVKKHFLRMHREMQYDINKTRRHVPSSSNHSGGRGNVTINTLNNSSNSASGSPEQKPNIFHAANVQIDNAFLEGQRQPTSSSLSIAETIEAVATAADAPLPQLKQEKPDDVGAVGGVPVKPKREKRFTCCYCPWSGADKWGLKRHLNTHTKPFVCLLCDYKAARSERLATHVLKVHNKRACNKCSFLADTQEEFQAHTNEVHLLKMDAISRNTASVAQDFHKAGGVHELKIPANHQLLFNNKLPSQWTTKEAAALLYSLSNSTPINYACKQDQILQQQQQTRSNYHNGGGKRQRHQSIGDDDECTPSSSTSSTTSNEGVSPMKIQRLLLDRKSHLLASTTNTTVNEQRKAMSAFLSKNFDLQEVQKSNSNEYLASSKIKREYSKHYDGVADIDNAINGDDHHDVANDEDQENQVQLIKSSPAYKNQNQINYNNNNNNQMRTTNRTNNNNHNYHRQQNAGNNNNNIHRLDLHSKDNKENNNVAAAATFLSTMEFRNLNKIGTQFQNYVKDIINKYYAETPLLFPAMPIATTTPQQSQQNHSNSPNRKRMLSETEQYIEYLKNKEDITLTITPKSHNNNGNSSVPKSTSPLKRHHDLSASPQKRQSSSNKHKKSAHATTLFTPPTQPPPPSASQKDTLPPSNGNKTRKSLTEIATLLPLLADAACQQQYLTAPLDFSKKSKSTPMDVDKHNTNDNINININNNVISANKVTVHHNEDKEAAALSPYDKRSSRKQAQPKKIRAPPEVVVTMLRDKYLNRMVNRKLSCCKTKTMLVFNYHTKGSLALHRLWKHKKRGESCPVCKEHFKFKYSYIVHSKLVHGIDVTVEKKTE